jgi:transcriptional regulator with XRE-family HTH domain
MEPISISAYKKELQHRIRSVMKSADLMESGLAEFTGLSLSHVYAILSGHRDLTTETAEQIAGKFKMTAAQLLKLDHPIAGDFNKVDALNKFKDENKFNPGYFISKQAEKKVTAYIQSMVETSLFREGADVSQIKDACMANGKKYTSKQISQTVNYLAEVRKLNKETRRKRKKNGEEGERLVYVFFSPDRDKGVDDPASSSTLQS